MPQTQSAFPTDSHLTSIAIAVKNRAAIADKVLPRSAPMSKSTFTYKYFKDEQAFTLPDTKVGRKSEVNQVDFEGKEITSATDDYGLDSLIPSHDRANSYDGLNPEDLAAEMLSDLIILDREVRTANLIMDVNTYNGNSQTLAASDRFDANASDPLGLMAEAIDTPIMRPNLMVIGQKEWRILRQHPKVVKAANGNNGNEGFASRQVIADLLEIEDILVGQALFNTAKPNQTPTMKSAWTGGVSFIYQNTVMARQAGTTFGFTAQFGGKVAGKIPEPKKGLRGGTLVRVGESVKETICAPSLGYLLKDVIAP